MERDELIRQYAAITGVSVSEIEAAIDMFIAANNRPQPFVM